MEVPVIHIQLDDDGTARTINGFVKVRMIAEKHIYGQLSVEEIATHYNLSVADVYAALAYYHDNYDYYKKREDVLKPLIEKTEAYTSDLNKKIKDRLEEKKSND